MDGGREGGNEFLKTESVRAVGAAPHPLLGPLGALGIARRSPGPGGARSGSCALERSGASWPGASAAEGSRPALRRTSPAKRRRPTCARPAGGRPLPSPGSRRANPRAAPLTCGSASALPGALPWSRAAPRSSWGAPDSEHRGKSPPASPRDLTFRIPREVRPGSPSWVSVQPFEVKTLRSPHAAGWCQGNEPRAEGASCRESAASGTKIGRLRSRSLPNCEFMGMLCPPCGPTEL